MQYFVSLKLFIKRFVVNRTYTNIIMKKTCFLLTSALFLALCGFSQDKTFHDFKVRNIDGDTVDLSSFAGKKVMVVNVASKCGFTKQYTQLQELYTEYGGDDFTIIAFPANNFLGQEPGTNQEIKEFCTSNYGVTFPVMGKISVSVYNYTKFPPDTATATDTTIHPLYGWLTTKAQNGVKDTQVVWNFQKFLIDENGKFVEVLSPRVSPDHEKIIAWITGE